MGEKFELTYTDSATGMLVKTEVSGLGLAKQLAKKLAKASGRRAVICRKYPVPVLLWSVHLADVETGKVECVWTGLTKREVLLRWRLWKEGRTNCVLVAWPEWMPRLSMSLDAAA